MMKSWSIENEKWTLDIWAEGKRPWPAVGPWGGGRFSYKSSGDVILSISEPWAAWLTSGYPS